MATVYQYLDPVGAKLPTSNAAGISQVDGSAFPAVGLAFDADADEEAYWYFIARNYGSGNVTVNIWWYADTGLTADVIWGAALAAVTANGDTQDFETKALATAVTATDPHLGTTAKRLHQAVVVITNLDSLAANDHVALKLYRDADNVSDDMSGDAIVTSVEVSYSDT